jgi:hypothetical protein
LIVNGLRPDLLLIVMGTARDLAEDGLAAAREAVFEPTAAL